MKPVCDYCHLPFASADDAADVTDLSTGFTRFKKSCMPCIYLKISDPRFIPSEEDTRAELDRRGFTPIAGAGAGAGAGALRVSAATGVVAGKIFIPSSRPLIVPFEPIWRIVCRSSCLPHREEDIVLERLSKYGCFNLCLNFIFDPVRGDWWASKCDTSALMTLASRLILAGHSNECAHLLTRLNVSRFSTIEKLSLIYLAQKLGDPTLLTAISTWLGQSVESYISLNRSFWDTAYPLFEEGPRPPATPIPLHRTSDEGIDLEIAILAFTGYRGMKASVAEMYFGDCLEKKDYGTCLNILRRHPIGTYYFLDRAFETFIQEGFDLGLDEILPKMDFSSPHLCLSSIVETMLRYCPPEQFDKIRAIPSFSLMFSSLSEKQKAFIRDDLTRFPGSYGHINLPKLS